MTEDAKPPQLTVEQVRERIETYLKEWEQQYERHRQLKELQRSIDEADTLLAFIRLQLKPHAYRYIARADGALVLIDAWGQVISVKCLGESP